MTTGNTQHFASTADLREIAADVFDLALEEIVDGAAFYDDLGADSFQIVELIVRLERRFTVKFDNEEVANVREIRDVVSLLRGKGIAVEG